MAAGCTSMEKNDALRSPLLDKYRSGNSLRACSKDTNEYKRAPSEGADHENTGCFR